MLLDRLTLVLMDFGIAMVVDAGYLAYKKQQSKLFWVPGLIAFVLSLVIYLFASLIDRVADGIRNPGGSEQAELLVELGPDDHIKELKPIFKRYSASYQKAFEQIDATVDATLDGSDSKNLDQYYAIFVDEALITPLMKDLRADRENVDQVEQNHAMRYYEPVLESAPAVDSKTYLTNDPQIGQQWFADKLAYNDVHKMLRDRRPKRKAKVAIIDTGVDSKHEDLASIFIKSSGKKDGNGHGTHCAGLAAAATNNKTGIASLNWEGRYIQVLSYAGLGKTGIGTDRSIAQAIISAANAGADVISLSLGAPGKAPKAQQDAINYALKKGAIVIAAAGNSNKKASDHTPANIDGVITVSAVDQFFNKATFSNTNNALKMPLAAPGVDILSLIPDSRYKTMSGTSMATPIVAGIIGIMRSFKPSLSPQEAYDVLQATGKSVPDSYRIGKVVQPYPALQLLIDSKPL